LTQEAETVDFKPFFDMVVGILFILLILISAQLFFAQHANEEDTASQEAQRLALERERQTTAFLEDIASRLRSKDVPARVDRYRRAVVLPLAKLMSLGSEGVPQFANASLGALGVVLSERLPCVVTIPRRTGDCPDSDLLHLGQVDAELRLQRAPENTSLQQDRFAQLATTLFSAALLSRQPELLGLTNRAGTPIVRFSGLTPGPRSDQEGSAGELSLVFVFLP
jgi:hypothetical protein